MGVYKLYSYALSRKAEVSTEVSLGEGSVLLVDASGLLHEISERTSAAQPSEPLFFAQFASYQAFHAAVLEYLAPFRAVGVKLIFVFDNNIGVRTPTSFSAHHHHDS
jgi:hypothetical protein